MISAIFKKICHKIALSENERATINMPYYDPIFLELPKREPRYYVSHTTYKVTSTVQEVEAAVRFHCLKVMWGKIQGMQKLGLIATTGFAQPALSIVFYDGIIFYINPILSTNDQNTLFKYINRINNKIKRSIVI